MQLIEFFKHKLFKTSKKVDIPKNEAFCMAPWVHIHALPGGNIYPCCQSAHMEEATIGNFKSTSLLDAWNSHGMQTLRKKMLNGKKSKFCEKCYAEDARGQESMRQMLNKQFQHHGKRLQQTTESGFLENQKIPYLDIRFSNVCNFRCRICGPEYSTKWYEDAVSLSPAYKSMFPQKRVVHQDINALWASIEPHIDSLEFVQFAGGEPMIMEEHFLILKRLHELKKWDIRITYNTNFSVRKFGKNDIFKLWKNFNNVLVMASLDAMGKRGEYLRKGQNWTQTERLRQQMMDECPQVNFRLDPTVSIHNVYHLPDFYQNWVDKQFLNPNNIRINILYAPAEYSVVNLPLHHKTIVKQKYEEFIAKNHLASPQLLNEFQSVINYMFSEEGNNAKNFKHSTERLDKLRNENFVEVFPELADLMN